MTTSIRFTWPFSMQEPIAGQTIQGFITCRGSGYISLVLYKASHYGCTTLKTRLAM